jgi:hypothetical protein
VAHALSFRITDHERAFQWQIFYDHDADLSLISSGVAVLGTAAGARARAMRDSASTSGWPAPGSKAREAGEGLRVLTPAAHARKPTRDGVIPDHRARCTRAIAPSLVEGDARTA